MTTCAIRFLPRRTRRLAGSALRMPAVANDRWLLADALAIVAAILAALRRRAIASRMHALFNFLLGRRNPLSCVFSCRRAYAHAHPKSIPLKLISTGAEEWTEVTKTTPPMVRPPVRVSS